MTTERPKQKNPATDPDNRQNGQGEHHGKQHSPDEFDTMNPAKQDNDNKRTISPQS